MKNAVNGFWPWAGIAALILFFAAVLLISLCLRQKRYALLPAAAVNLALSYFSLQCISIYASENRYGRIVMSMTDWFVSLPTFCVVLLYVLNALVLALLFRTLHRYESSEITAMSVKEAADSLPSGLCYYLPSGRIIMVNQAMERFCRMTTGGVLTSGKLFREQVFSGQLHNGCQTVVIGQTPVITLPDKTVWTVTEQESRCEEETVHMLLATEVTEIYHKTLSLQKMKETLSALNKRLTAYNGEIVALTAEKELLSARVRLHDEMGADLLSMKQFIQNGGSEEKRAEIEARLRRNVSFLKTGQASASRDEYELMLETAEKLGVRVTVQGTLPQTEPQKHVIATAIHECFTNTIRHARGTELHVMLSEDDHHITARFTNNGEQPREEIQEKGGLASLRTLAEYAGGGLQISVSPVFSVTLTLPWEVSNAI